MFLADSEKRNRRKRSLRLFFFFFSHLFLQQQQMKKGGGTSFSLFCHLLLFAIETYDKKEGGNSVRFFFFCRLFLFITGKDDKRTVELPFPFSVSSFLHSVINPIPTTECKPNITNPKAQTINLTSKNVMWLLCTKIYKKCAHESKKREIENFIGILVALTLFLCSTPVCSYVQ